MTTRTRYFVVCSLLVMTVGVGSGLVAYYNGFKLGQLAGRGGPAELDYIPDDAAVVAYVDVRQIMSSELRQKLQEAVPAHENGKQEFENETGINIETDIDHVVTAFQAGAGNGAGLVLARGRFNDTKIESLMRSKGGTVDTYRGKRMVLTPEHGVGHISTAPQGSSGQATMIAAGFAVAFIEPGLVGVGSATLVRSAIEAHETGRTASTNHELMKLVSSLETGNAWAIGRFDALQAQAKLPANVADRIPSITWFSVAANVDGGVRGLVRAETRDDEAARNLKDVVRGFMALAKLQTTSNPQLQTMVQGLELGGSGKTVTLSFVVPADAFDTLIKAHASPAMRGMHHMQDQHSGGTTNPNQRNR